MIKRTLYRTRRITLAQVYTGLRFIMAPSALHDDSYSLSMPRRSPRATRSYVVQERPVIDDTVNVDSENLEQYCFARNLRADLPVAEYAQGAYIFDSGGRAILDMAGGAAVSCLGHNSKRVLEAIAKQNATGITYIASPFWKCRVVEYTCAELVRGTGYEMTLAFIINSGQLRVSLSLCYILMMSRLRSYGSRTQNGMSIPYRERPQIHAPLLHCPRA